MSEMMNAQGREGLGRFKPYPEYRDSGVEWLGEIPAHWEVRRLKTIAFLQVSNVDKKSVEGQEPVRLCNYLHVYNHERITPELDFMAATATVDQIRRFRLRSGDVLITKDSETPDDIAVPAVVLQDLADVICGYHLAHIRPKASIVYGPFLARAFAAVGVRDQFHVAANGITRFGLTLDAMRSAVFPVPPLEEQCAIAAFLDGETAKIDALAAKKERLIELLQEKRAALINQAVTRGLDPAVPAKDSGVEWLGVIPAHWEVKRLKHVARIMSGLAPPPSFDRFIGEYPVYGSNGLIGYCDEYIVSQDVLVVGRVGASGSVNLVPAKSWVSDNALMLCSLSCTVRLAWLRYVLEAMNLGAQAVKNAQPIITGTSLGNQILPIPPEDEQRAIAAFLNRETAKIDALIVKVREGIERLKEYRTALISAAVTGKIDARRTRWVESKMSEPYSVKDGPCYDQSGLSEGVDPYA